MPRAESHRLPHPLFNEPTFAEGNATSDPTGFVEPHPSDAALYREVEALLKTKVVGFPPSRVAPEALFTLAEATARMARTRRGRSLRPAASSSHAVSSAT